ncbi:MAG: hypothetical protein J0L75_09650 [Spirochaetes bacterium]|nr:hypothetical protein [Spirochaetota bacterium]
MKPRSVLILTACGALLALASALLPHPGLRIGAAALALLCWFLPLPPLWRRLREKERETAALGREIDGLIEKERLRQAQHQEELRRQADEFEKRLERAKAEPLSRMEELTQALERIPPDLRGKTLGLGVLLSQLASVRSQIETTAATIGAAFFEIHAKAKSQSAKTESVFASLSGDEFGGGGNVLDSTKTALNALVANVREAGDVSRRNLDSVGRIIQQSERIGSHLHSIAEIADRTNVLAINAGIEAARAGVHGKGFSVVAQEVRKLSQLTERTAHDIKSILSDMTATARDIHREIESGAATVARQAGDAEHLFASTVGRINGVIESIRGEMEGLRRDAESLAKNTSEAVISMQFHDIIRQRVEHVLEPLTQVRAQLGELGAGLEPYAGNAAPQSNRDAIAAWLAGFYTMKEEMDILKESLGGQTPPKA